MFHINFKNEIKKVVFDVRQRNMKPMTAERKLDDMFKVTKTSLLKGHKREVKNEIYWARQEIKKIHTNGGFRLGGMNQI